ncbi:MAG: ATP-dependent DNA helicase [Acidimicrobiia bacterium]|nr:ATP-dependent DNA helicase [Acidimicrobiia bacterium]
MSLSEQSLDALEAVIASKPGGSRRTGQVEMASAVAKAIETERHLLVEAGTGTGKSFGYLIPAICSGRRVVVSTATKSLQDQLDRRDLPFLAEALAPQGIEFAWAAVKGRQSYLCKSRLAERLEVEGIDFQRDLFSEPATGEPGDLAELAVWAMDHPTGDRDDLPHPIDDTAWSDVSVSGTECPGRDACPSGFECFAMAALDRAAEADIVVVNHHLYGAHLMADKSVLPEHDIVIFDEGHRLEDTFASAFGFEIAPWRFRQLDRAARYLRGVVGSRKADGLTEALDAASAGLGRILESQEGARVLDTAQSGVDTPMLAAARAVGRIGHEARSGTTATLAQTGAKARLVRLAGHLEADLTIGATVPDGHVAWINRGAYLVAPIDVGSTLAEKLLGDTTVIVTSATLSSGGSLLPLAASLGFETERTSGLRVASPFDFSEQGRIYVAAHLPEPNAPEFADEAVDEVLALVEAAGGRSLVLTTSYRMLDRFAEALVSLPDLRVLVQGELSKRQLAEIFENDETSVLVATMGFWEGLDVPGRSLELVILDRLPFPRPNDPLWVARREAAEASGRNAFLTIDLPRAAMLAAQGAGRLIRTTSDRGVVALLDSRVATRRYGQTIIRSLPPMPVVSDRSAVATFLAG